jgi:hypothetical protein
MDHPALAGPAPPGSGAVTKAGALLDAQLLMPILDGLDEIPAALRGSAIASINDAIRPGERLVVTCRTSAYHAAVQAPGGARATLRGAAGVELCPLDEKAVTDYLSKDAGGQHRWKQVTDSLGGQDPVAAVLANPLMVSLARAVYNPRPGEHAGPLPDPAELCTFASREDIERNLMDGFIPAAYRPYLPSGSERIWSAKKAEKWLIFLALHLEETIGEPDFAWWQLVRALPGLAAGLAAGLVSAVVVVRWPGSFGILSSGSQEVPPS